MDVNPLELPWDEEYWQIVLEQGEAPSSEGWPQEPNHLGWDREAPTGWENGEFEAGADERPRSQTNPRQLGWQAARALMEQAGSVELDAVGYNRGGLLVQWDQLQGFVPASHLIGMPRVADPDVRRSYLGRRVGQTLCLRVIEIDESRDRLVLSERAATVLASARDPLDRLSKGDRCHGRVSTVCDFGVFVDLGGIEGLVHISELSWGRVRQPADIAQIGQEVDVLVLNVDPLARKVALSLKQLQPDPWTRVEQTYQLGQTISGRVTNVVSFGAFVEIEDGIEGLVHISELAEGTFMHPRNVVSEGQDVVARVVSIDVQNHRLGLSLRAGSPADVSA